MRAFCQKQQNEAIIGMRERSMVTPDRQKIRAECFSDWPDDYRMRNYCEGRQLEALAKIR